MTAPTINRTSPEQTQYLQQPANAAAVETGQKTVGKGALAHNQDIPEARDPAAASEALSLAPSSGASLSAASGHGSATAAKYKALASDSGSYLTADAAAQQLGELAIKLCFRMQQEAKDRVRQCSDMRVAFIKGEADLMHKEADSIRDAALAQGVFTACAGACQIFSGMAGSKSEAADQTISGMADSKSGAAEWWGASKISEAAGTYFGGNASAQQKEFQAQEKTAEANAERAGGTADTSKKFADSLQQHIANMTEQLDRQGRAIPQMRV